MKAQFDHVAFVVKNVAEAVSFYSATFDDVEVLYLDESWAFISVGGAKLAFVIAEQHPPHLAMRIDDRAAFEASAMKHGKKISVHRDLSESFYFEDPSGNVVEIMFYPEGYRL
jgi:catechol-2,3-dioxygenase